MMLEKKSHTTTEEAMLTLGKRARQGSHALAKASTEQKNKALMLAAAEIRAQKKHILAANEKDMAAAKKKGLTSALLDRLALNDERVEAMAVGIEAIAKLDDPVGKQLASWKGNNNGLTITRYSVALGVIGIIYESRPNVTADAGALCLKSGNAVILRGGSESFHSSGAIVNALHSALEQAELPKDIISQVPVTGHEAVGVMLSMSDYIDVIIPRGGKNLCARVQQESRVPTLLHLEGNCFSYIHEKTDQDMAVSVITNAKMRRTGICGATESIVIDESIAASILPKLVDRLHKAGCEIRGDQTAQAIDERINTAKESDWDTEYLAAIISIKIVSGIDEAIDFINVHHSQHTDAILTQDTEAAQRFQREIDSAIVMHNTSTQFADGGEFGMGAEIGIATGKLHARGPVGVEQLTTYKYLVTSNGSTRP